MNLWSLHVFRSAWRVQVLSPECSTHIIKDTYAVLRKYVKALISTQDYNK